MLFISVVDDMLSEKGLGFVSNIINIIFVVAAAIFIVWAAKRVVRRVAELHKSKDPARKKRIGTAESIIISIVKYVTYFVAAALVASELGFGTSVRSLLAAAGIGGVVIGIGAQSLISDIVNGFFFLFEDLFTVGDTISTAGVTGTVEAIGLRATTIVAYTGERIVVPNGSITTITNYSRTNARAVINIPVAVDADTEKAYAIIKEETQKYREEHPDIVLEDATIHGIDAVDAFSKKIRITVKVKPLAHWNVQRELNDILTGALVRGGIKFPTVLYTGTEKE
jgi:moderate conductance mechanosensitive channel